MRPAMCMRVLAATVATSFKETLQVFVNVAAIEALLEKNGEELERAVRE